jgi:hypothetical protein
MQRNFRQAAALIAACFLTWSAPVQAQIRKLGPAFQANTTLSPNAQDPAVEGNKRGFVVSWVAVGSGILGQKFDAAGKSVGPEFAIGDSLGGYQAISIDAQGGFLVAWDEWEDDQRSNFVQRFNEMGEPLGNRIPIGDSRAHSPAIVQDLAGGFGVFWIQGSDEVDTQYRLFGEWFSREGIPRGDPFVIAQGEVTCDPWEGCWDAVSGPAAARDPAGNFVLAWSEYPQVFGLRFNPEGQAQGGRFTIGEGGGRPSVEFRKNGSFQVVWTQLIDGGAFDGHEHALFGRQFSPLGVPLTDNVLIQSSEPCSALAPVVRAQSGGGFLLVWYEQCDNGPRPVRSRRLNALGEPVGAVLELSRPTSTYNESPALARVGNGDFIAVWQEWPNRIFGQRLHMLPDPAAINAGHSDAWYNPQTPGQGFFITVLTESEKIFLAWFTFDTERPPAGIAAALGDPGHRWLTALGDYSGTSAVLEVALTSGGVFDAAHPAVTHTSSYGTISLKFSGCNELELAYDLPSANRSGVIGLERISGENVTLCEVLNSR